MKRANFLVKNVIDSMDDCSKGTILRSMAIFTAIELCGSIMRGKTGQGTSSANFTGFMKSKYMNKKYRGVSDLLYKIFRCGVAHSYISKGAALLSSDPKEKRKHLRCYENGLLVYVPTLDKDVRSGIRKLYKELKRDIVMKGNYKKVIRQLDTDGLSAYSSFLKENNIKPKKTRIERDIVTELL